MGTRALQNIERLNGILAVVLILAAAVFTERAMALGVTVGAALAVVNFTGMRRLVVASMKREGTSRASLQLLLVAKMGVLFFLIFLAIRYLPLHPVGLAVGLSVFLISITVESIRWALGPRGEEPDGNEAHDG